MINSNKEIIEVNKKQKEFYNTKKKNFVSKIWAKIRGGLLNSSRQKLGIKEQTYETHLEWIGDVSNKKVLDLGCFEGNHFSLYLAEHSKEYIAIDLSDLAIEKLKKRLEPFDNSRAIAVDFFSNDFEEKEFDLIYAFGVLHHFEDKKMLISKLNEKLNKNGEIISYDPLTTSLPIKILRFIYRPFQTDAAWEWPFTKKDYKLYDVSFNIIEKRGVLGKSKWFFMLNLLPLSNSKRIIIGKRWHQSDWDLSATNDSRMYRCMHLTMRMKKK